MDFAQGSVRSQDHFKMQDGKKLKSVAVLKNRDDIVMTRAREKMLSKTVKNVIFRLLKKAKKCYFYVKRQRLFKGVFSTFIVLWHRSRWQQQFSEGSAQ